MALTDEQIEKNAHISTETITKDIYDTIREIQHYREQIDLNKQRIVFAEEQIKSRQEFIEKLREILWHRETHAN